MPDYLAQLLLDAQRLLTFAAGLWLCAFGTIAIIRLPAMLRLARRQRRPRQLRKR